VEIKDDEEGRKKKKKAKKGLTTRMNDVEISIFKLICD